MNIDLHQNMKVMPEHYESQMSTGRMSGGALNSDRVMLNEEIKEKKKKKKIYQNANEEEIYTFKNKNAGMNHKFNKEEIEREFHDYEAFQQKKKRKG
mmetsp:Transcript_35298/g.34297  ORF Transcript_35298/g.34297 Transcript_35298/m.34297 type:complete len:97 (+) Transcript_35298:2074-2364(+)